ncbi:MAG TPA: presqualene diphosphate synthase HpnD [Roseiarcus sp.]|nr:presqualene diphosphate synthase HpnD [Roseiarcus sp.]
MSSQPAPAANSSFYSAMRILPARQREAMFALYGFCRAVDDIADDRGPASAAERLAELERWRGDIAAIFEGRTPNHIATLAPHLATLAEVTRTYHLKHDDFDAVIDGMAMDAERDIRAPDWETLDLYCDRVASAVGRLSVRIFGLADERGVALAHHLGRALQLTNILRDIDEDAGAGRLYLPREALTAAGVTSEEPLTAAADPRLAQACVAVATRAREHFERARSVMATAPRPAVKAPRLMAVAYGSILDKMVKEGFAPPRRRAKASRLRLIGALLRYGVL